VVGHIARAVADDPEDADASAAAPGGEAEDG
jgi:hypothetical protein